MRSQAKCIILVYNTPVARRITTTEIASETGYHQTTVSRALKNHPAIPKKTCEVIQKAARKLGYTPDPALSALSRYRKELKASSYQGIIALISNRPSALAWRKHFIGKLYYKGLKRQAAKLGYEIEEFSLNPKAMRTEQFHRISRAKNIKGIILGRLHKDFPMVELDWDRYSVVSLGSTLPENPFSRVAPDLYLASYQLMEKLINQGYRKFGLLVIREVDERMDRANAAGVGRACWEYPNEIEVHRYFPSLQEWNCENVTRWVNEVRPEVIVTSHDEVLEWLRKMKLRVPGDIGMAHFNCRSREGKITGIFQNPESVGEAAVVMLAGMLECNRLGIPQLSHKLLIPGTWIRGKTTRRV
ncbi:MAG: LacI family DNA-binding transcriptional regulator [Verrucomicrobiota bacterium]